MTTKELIDKVYRALRESDEQDLGLLSKPFIYNGKAIGELVYADGTVDLVVNRQDGETDQQLMQLYDRDDFERFAVREATCLQGNYVYVVVRVYGSDRGTPELYQHLYDEFGRIVASEHSWQTVAQQGQPSVTFDRYKYYYNDHGHAVGPQQDTGFYLEFTGYEHKPYEIHFNDKKLNELFEQRRASKEASELESLMALTGISRQWAKYYLSNQIRPGFLKEMVDGIV